MVDIGSWSIGDVVLVPILIPPLAFGQCVPHVTLRNRAALMDTGWGWDWLMGYWAYEGLGVYSYIALLQFDHEPILQMFPVFAISCWSALFTSDYNSQSTLPGFPCRNLSIVTCDIKLRSGPHRWEFMTGSTTTDHVPLRFPHSVVSLVCSSSLSMIHVCLNFSRHLCA